ncbi:MAG: 3-oxoacid CoA-transferase subunit A [Dehalococcoidia bacterium]|nr:3-oxoacid CoA-transferase subunit A [Dehalococcoidia bacterium]
MNKVFRNCAEAVKDIPDGATIMVGAFAGPGGMPSHLLVALREQGARDLTIIANNVGIGSGYGAVPGESYIDITVLVENRQVSKAIASFPVSPSPSRPTAFEKLYLEGKVELELVPQGTLAERIRAGGAGIGGFFTPTGVGTLIAAGKEHRVIDGKEYILENPLRADYALIRAHRADTYGNLTYRMTSRHFNAVMAMAADVTIAEVDEIVEPGGLDPNTIATPCVFVQRIVKRATEVENEG